VPDQLVSYIALAAPATRRPTRGDEPFLRPEIGFTPNWYRQAVGIDFGERWHTDFAYRLRGADLFIDMALEPSRATHLFECVRTTMAEGARQLYATQRQTGIEAGVPDERVLAAAEICRSLSDHHQGD